MRRAKGSPRASRRPTVPARPSTTLSNPQGASLRGPAASSNSSYVSCGQAPLRASSVNSRTIHKKQHLQSLRQNSTEGHSPAVVAMARDPRPFHLKFWGSCSWLCAQCYDRLFEGPVLSRRPTQTERRRTMNWCVVLVTALVTTALRAAYAALPSGQPEPATGHQPRATEAPPEAAGP